MFYIREVVGDGFGFVAFFGEVIAEVFEKIFNGILGDVRNVTFKVGEGKDLVEEASEVSQ